MVNSINISRKILPKLSKMRLYGPNIIISIVHLSKGILGLAERLGLKFTHKRQTRTFKKELENKTTTGDLN